MRWFCFVLTLFLTLPAQAAEKPRLVLNTPGHAGSITEVFFTPDGEQLISTGQDKTIRIWDTASGELRRTLRLPLGEADTVKLNEGIIAAALTRDGRLLAVGARTLEKDRWAVYVIDLAAGRVQAHLPLPMSSEALAWSPDGSWLAIGMGTGVIRRWQPSTGKTGRLTRHKREINSLAFSPDGKVLASGDKSGLVRLSSWPDGPIRDLATPGGVVHRVAWSPDGSTVVGDYRGSVVRLWKADGTVLQTIEVRKNGQGLDFSADSRELAVGTKLISLPGGKVKASFPRQLNGFCHSVAMSKDGRTIALGGSTGLYLWNPGANSLAQHLGSSELRPEQVGWLPDNRGIVWRMLASDDSPTPLLGFNFDKLDLKRVPSTGDYRFAIHRREDYTLEKPDAYNTILKRGSSTIARLAEPTGRGNAAASSFLGEKFALAGGSRGLMLFDGLTGAHQRTWPTAGMVKALAPDGNSHYIATASHDSRIRIWTVDRDEPLLQFHAADNDWIAWTPEGYYAASPGGERLMGWQINNGSDKLATFHAAAQFRATHHRPEVIRRILELGDTRKALEGTKAANAARVIETDQVLPPRVSIVQPAQPRLEVTTAKLQIKAVAESVGDHPVAALQLLLNGRPLTLSRGLRLVKTPATGRKEEAWDIDLIPGLNEVTIVARNDAGNTSTSDALQIVYRPPQKQDARSTLHVLAIGINAYPGDWQLSCAVNDATDLVRALQAGAKQRFKEVKPQLLLDKEATAAGIRKALLQLRAQVKPQDVAVIFYAGHGELDKESRFLLLPSDVDFNKVEQTSFTGEELKTHLAELPCRTLLLLDACHAAPIRNINSKSIRRVPTDGLSQELAREENGVVVMVAAQGEEESREDLKVKHGYFTLALLEGLQGKADYNRNGAIDLSELILYVENRVGELSQQRQRPAMGKPPTVPSFVLAEVALAKGT